MPLHSYGKYVGMFKSFSLSVHIGTEGRIHAEANSHQLSYQKLINKILKYWRGWIGLIHDDVPGFSEMYHKIMT